MLTLLIIVGLLASIFNALLAIRTRRSRWFVASLPFLLVPVALYAVVALACYFGRDCL
jgi:hypothetical protein